VDSMGPEHWSKPIQLEWRKGKLTNSGKIRGQSMQIHVDQIKEIILKNQENHYCTWNRAIWVKTCIWNYHPHYHVDYGLKNIKRAAMDTS
jgi:hypothetical protein